jgi:hypothetical protein
VKTHSQFEVNNNNNNNNNNKNKSQDPKEFRLLGCDAVWLLQDPTFRRNCRLYHQGKKIQRVKNSVRSN